MPNLWQDAHTLRYRLAVAMVSLLLYSASYVFALDYNDIRELVRNQVPDEAIINVVLQSDSLEISDQEADELRSLGASQRLIDILVITPFDFEDVRQLLINRVPEQAIMNVVRQSRVIPLTTDEIGELRVMGASEELIAFLIVRARELSPDVYERIGDGTGTVLTLDDLQNGSGYYVNDSGVVVYSNPEVVVSPPTIIYQDSEPYYYPDYHDSYYNYSPFGGFYYYSRGRDRGRRPSPPPPPRERPSPPPRPPAGGRPPEVKPQPPKGYAVPPPKGPSDNGRPRPPAVRPPPQGGNKPTPPPAGNRPPPGEGRPRPPAGGNRPPARPPSPPPAGKPEARPPRPEGGNRPAQKPPASRPPAQKPPASKPPAAKPPAAKPLAVKPERPARPNPPGRAEKQERPSRSPNKPGSGKRPIQEEP